VKERILLTRTAVQTDPQTAMPLTRRQPAPWHVVTCEYPPQSGGVSDYTYLVAEGLAAHGDQVHIWCPAAKEQAPQVPGVDVRQTLGRFSIADLRSLGRNLDAFPSPRHILVQWVPHGFGYKSVNLPFCLWLWGRARRGDTVDLMVHEPFLPFAPGRWRQNAAATVHRIMMRILLRSAGRVWLSTPAWEPLIRPFDWNRERKYQWLPLPSTVPAVNDRAASLQLKDRYNAAGVLLGHFGTFGPSVTPMLGAIIPPLLQASPGAAMILIGPGSAAFREHLVRDFPGLAPALFAVGQIDARDPRLSLHISACDLLIQPYPDGVTGRRTSMMAALSHGRPTITTSGPFTEPMWKESRAVVLTPADDMDALVTSARQLIENPAARAALGESGQAFYRRNFDIEHVVDLLRGDSGAQ
jgi:glycosyltransferase involved in cell wall biosynthesis